MQKIKPAYLFIGCLLSRALYMALKFDTLTRGGAEYEDLANIYLQTGSINFPHFGKLLPSAHMPPGLVFLIIFLKKFFLPYYHVIIFALHLGLALLCLWLLLKLCEKCFGTNIARLSGALYVLDINLLIPTAWINETIYTMTLILLATLFMAKTMETPSYRNAANLGAIMGLGALFRSTLLLHFGTAFLWLYWTLKKKPAHANPFFVPLVMGVFFFLVLSPWVIRNYLVFKKIIPVSQNLGLNLHQGWSPNSCGSEYQCDGSKVAMDPVVEERLKQADSELEMNRILVHTCLNYAREDPARWVKQRILSFLFFWHEHNFWSPKNPFYTLPWRTIGFLNIFFLLLFVVSLIHCLNKKGIVRYILLILLTHSGIHTLIHANIGSRFRYQIEPLMLILIALFLYERFGSFFKTDAGPNRK